MTRRPARRRPMVEGLEARTLLAASIGSIPAADLTYAHNFLPAAQAGFLQLHSSVKNLETFAARLAQVRATRPEVVQLANQVIVDNMGAKLEAHLLATNKDVVLPPNPIGTDEGFARLLVYSLDDGNFDQTFLTAMTQINTAALGLGSTILGADGKGAGAVDSDVLAYAQEAAALSQSHLAAATNLLNGQPSGLGSGTTPAATNTTTASTADAAYLQAIHSSNAFEIMTSQIALVTSTDAGVQRYAQKLIFDHTMADMKIMQIANATGVSLAPTLMPQAASTAQTLVTLAPTGAYTTAYLGAQVPMHRMTQQRDIQAAASAQDPNIREFARTDIGTTEVHILAAQQLLTRQASSLLPSGLTSDDLNVRVRRVNRFRYVVVARLNGGGLNYMTRTMVRLPRQNGGNGQPNPTDAQIQQAVFQSLNAFLSSIGNANNDGGSNNGGGNNNGGSNNGGSNGGSNSGNNGGGNNGGSTGNNGGGTGGNGGGTTNNGGSTGNAGTDGNSGGGGNR